MVLETDAETALSLFEMAKESYDRSAKKWPTEPAAPEFVRAEDVFFQEQDEGEETEKEK